MYFTHPQLKNLKPLFNKTSEAELKQKLSKFFPNREIVFTNQGRSAFQLAIEHLNLHNTEMIFPAYICDIFEPIIKKYDIKPIYIDVDLKTFNMDINQIEKNITPQTKSILVCHTYGYPNDMDKIKELAKKYDLKIIEDCAHIFPSTTLEMSPPIRGNCAFFSFAKLMPAINGGMLISKNPINFNLKNHKFKLRNIIKFLRLFPVLARISEKFRLGYLRGNKSKGFSMGIPRRASKSSLRVFNWYLDNFEEQFSKRTKLAEYFHKKLQEIGFQSSGIAYISALVPKNIDRDKLFYKLRKKNIFCSRIWHKPLCPDLPNTSIVASRIINFPLQNWFTKKDIDKIISCIL